MASGWAGGPGDSVMLEREKEGEREVEEEEEESSQTCGGVSL